MSVNCIFSRLFSRNFKTTFRKFHGSSIIRKGAYDADGKTSISILNNDMTYGLMINSYSKGGFRLNNNFSLLGPIAIFPKSVLSWRINGIDDINEKSLSLFTILEPKLDVLIIGIGDYPRSRTFDKTILEFLRKHRLNIEIVPTNQACAIFNFLNAEGRYVGAGLIPPRVVSFVESDLLDDPDNLKALNRPADL